MPLTRRRMIITTAAFSCFLLFYHFRVLASLESLLALSLNPFQAFIVRQAHAVSANFEKISLSKKELTREITRLKSRVNQLTVKLIRFEAMRRENRELRSLLNFQKQTDYPMLIANVTQKTNLALEKAMTLDRGRKDGVEKGDAVVIDAGIIIGKVIRVKEHTSVVRLSIAPQSILMATLEGSPHTIAGTVTGAQGTGLLLQLIPKNVTLRVEQRVITNGLQEDIPASLYIGEVIAIEENENKIFNAARVMPPYIAEDLTIVAILLNTT